MAAGPLTAAVIGTGKISEQHLRFLAGSAVCRPVAVCDLSPVMARYAADRFDVAEARTDYRQMLDDLRPRVVHVLTPPHTHLEIASDCIRAGAHVIVEKPVALNRGDLHRLWAAAGDRGVRLVENHNYRFNRPVQQVEAWDRSGELGEVREVDVRMALNLRDPGNRYADENLPHPSHRLPAGVLHEFVTHLVYLLQRFMPGFDRVAAAWSNHGGGDLFKYDDLDALVFDGPVHGRLRFSAGTWPESFTVTVRGSKASAQADLFQPCVTIARPRGPKVLGPMLNRWSEGRTLKQSAKRSFFDKVMQRTAYEGLDTFLGKTYGALADGTAPPVSFEDMDNAARLIDALLDEKNGI